MYFDSDYVSNSDLKGIMDKVLGRQKPENIQAIYDAGTLNHQALLERYKADKWLQEKRLLSISPEEERKYFEQYTLAVTMANTVLEDTMCRNVIQSPDFRREHEWYRLNRLDLKGVRCKTDGDSKALSCVFEYKGLAVTTQSAFDDAIMRLDYDQSAFWYLNTTGLENYLIVGVSKVYPKRLFKRIINPGDLFYMRGEVKTLRAIENWKQYGLV